jgi:hypothetical protein
MARAMIGAARKMGLLHRLLTRQLRVDWVRPTIPKAVASKTVQPIVAVSIVNLAAGIRAIAGVYQVQNINAMALA